MFAPNQEPTRFSYEPLPYPREIRLMCLHAGDQTDEVRCTLQRIPLPDASHSEVYEALSYTWGNTGCKADIVCNGQLLSITQDLKLALQRLRQPDETLYYWADQICINQEDVSERADQVQLMREIYQHARNVVIWLGDAEVDRFWKTEPDELQNMEEDAPKSLNETLKSVESLTDNLIELSHREPSLVLGPLNMGSYGSPTKHDLRWRALSRVLRKPWFSRMWILQEVAVSKYAVIHYGQEKMPWQRLSQLLSLIEKSLPLRLWFLTQCEAAWAAICSVSTIEFLRSSTCFDFLDVLNLARDQEATDPRDKVFAVLGFCDQSTESIVPNYMQSIESVLTKTSRQQVSAAKSLKVLHYTHITTRYPSLPSWVPDWTIRQEFSQKYRNVIEPSLFNACGKRSSSFAWDDDEYHLIIAATFIDSLPCTQGTFIQFADRDPTQYIPSCMELAKNRKPVTPEQAPKETFWRSLIGNNMDARNPRIPDSAWGRNIDQYIEANNLAEYINSHTRSEHRSRSQLLRRHPIKWAQFYWYLQRDPRHIYEKIGRVNDAIEYIASGRAFVSTSKGRLGWVHESCQSGDMVVIIHGNQVPFVVRQHGDYWKLIGDCYIHGVMQGEAMVDGHDTVQLTLC